jgi:hypothetical protein
VQELALVLDLADLAPEQASAAEAILARPAAALAWVALGVELMRARWEPRLTQVSDPMGSVRAEVLALEAVGLP